MPPCEWGTVVNSLPNLSNAAPHHVAQLGEEHRTSGGEERTAHCLSQDNTIPGHSERLESWFRSNMTMITFMLFVTIGTIMSDQLRIFRNQPFAQAGDPPSIPEIIKLNIKPQNPVAPGSLTYQEMDVRASVRKEECDAPYDARLDTP